MSEYVWMFIGHGNPPQITQFPRRAYHIKGNPINIKEFDNAVSPLVR